MRYFATKSANRKAMKREPSLDALRGLAVVGMILSGYVAFNGTLPNWMYHVQTPGGGAHANIAGIGWVDLVLPFFLFALGAALPFSLSRKLEKGERITSISVDIIKRFGLLLFFAIFYRHVHPWFLSEHFSPTGREFLISFISLPLFVMIYMELPKSINPKLRLGIKLAGFAGAIILLSQLYYPAERVGFSLTRYDGVLWSLAWASVWGSFIWLLTRTNSMLRIAILPIVVALLLSAKQEGSWTATLLAFNPFNYLYKVEVVKTFCTQTLGMPNNFKWLFNLSSLKTLLVIIPALQAGEYLKSYLKHLEGNDEKDSKPQAKLLAIVATLCLLVVVVNTWFLYERWLVANFLLSLCAIILSFVVLKKYNGSSKTFIRQMLIAGAYLLIVGLCIEPFEGGIKKAPTTFSYYIVVTGLAFFTTLFFSCCTQLGLLNRCIKMLATTGKNPMFAYVSGRLLILPFFWLIGIYQLWDGMNANAWIGTLKGVIITALVVALTAVTVRFKWFWKS